MPARAMWSKYAFSVDGMPKLYIGRPSTTTSARFNSSISASEPSATAVCSGVRSPGLARKAPKRAASRCGIGSRARSRTMTWPPGFAARHFSMKRSASWVDWPLSAKMLERICRSVFIGCPFLVGLKASCFAQLLADPRDLGFAALERLRARVHGVVAKDQRMRMSYGRAEDERRVPVGLQINPGLGLLEHDELSRLDFFRCAQPAAVDREPSHVVHCRR